MSNCSLLLFTLQFPEWLKESGFAVRNLKWHVISHISSHVVRQVHSQEEELDSCRAFQSGVAAWGWAALWQTRGDRDVCLAHQRSPVVASVSAHMPNSSFKTYIWEKTLYAVLFTPPCQQRHSTSQNCIRDFKAGAETTKAWLHGFQTLKINTAVRVSIQEGITMPSAFSGG